MTMKNLDAIREKLEKADMKLVIRKGKAMSPVQLYVNAKSGTGIEINATDNTIRGCTRDDTGMVYDNLPARLVGFVNECKELAGIEMTTVCETPLGALSEDNQPEPVFDPPEEDCFVQDIDVLASPEKIMSQAIAKTDDAPIFAGAYIADFVPMISQIGRITIGNKGVSRGGKQIPQKLDHFRITTNNKDAAGVFKLDQQATEILGEKCVEIPITLPFDDPTLVLRMEYAMYAGNKRMCHGDGVNRATKLDGTVIKCDRTTCPNFIGVGKEKKCKLNGTLSVFLPTVGKFGGVYRLRSTSYYSLTETFTTLMMIYSETGGRLTGIPLKLTLSPRTVTPKGASSSNTVYIFNVVYDGTSKQMLDDYINVGAEQLRVREQIRRITANSVDAIWSEETEEEQADTNQEFYPNTVDMVVE